MDAQYSVVQSRIWWVKYNYRRLYKLFSNTSIMKLGDNYNSLQFEEQKLWKKSLINQKIDEFSHSTS